MKDKDDIKNLFNDALSGWETEVPPAVKVSIDKELFGQKKGGLFYRFRWVLLLFFIVSSTIFAFLFTNKSATPILTENTAETAQNTHENPHERESSNPVSQTKLFDVHDQNDSYSKSAVTHFKDNQGYEDISNDSSKSTKNDLENSAVLDSRKSENVLHHGKKNKASQSSSGKTSQKSTQQPDNQSETQMLPAYEINSAANKVTRNDSRSETFNPEKPKSVSSSSELVLNSPESNTDSEQQEKPNSLSNSLEDEIDSVLHADSILVSPKGKAEDVFVKSILIGANLGLHYGRNGINENTGVFEENRNLSLGFDISYQFKRNMMFTSGLHYQHRTEFFVSSSVQIDSVLLFSEPIFETIIDTATNDTTTVVIGFNDVYGLDTTFVSTSTDAVVRLLMLPLAFDFQIYRWKQHEFWLRSGANIGLYRVSGTALQTAESWTQNQFTMQLFARPAYSLNFGKLRAGVFGNFAYDAILPQTWLMNRQRWQIGFGFQVMYRL